MNNTIQTDFLEELGFDDDFADITSETSSVHFVPYFTVIDRDVDDRASQEDDECATSSE